MLKKIVMTIIACFAIGSGVNAQECLTQACFEQEQILPNSAQFSLSDSAQLIASLGAYARELKEQGLSDEQIFKVLQCELETNSNYAGIKYFTKRTLQVGSLIVISMVVSTSAAVILKKLVDILWYFRRSDS